MTMPPPPAPASSTARPAPPSPSSPTSTGQLVATLGGVAGAVACTAIGVAVGLGLAAIYSTPGGGLEDLWVLIFPLVLGAAGIVGGTALGTWGALRGRGHDRAAATAWLTVPFSILCLVGLPLFGSGVALVLGVPALARWITLRTLPPG